MPLAPQPHVTEAERDAGLRCVVVEGAYSSATTALTSGVILTARHVYGLAVELVWAVRTLRRLWTEKTTNGGR